MKTYNEQYLVKHPRLATDAADRITLAVANCLPWALYRLGEINDLRNAMEDATQRVFIQLPLTRRDVECDEITNLRLQVAAQDRLIFELARQVDEFRDVYNSLDSIFIAYMTQSRGGS